MDDFKLNSLLCIRQRVQKYKQNLMIFLATMFKRRPHRRNAIDQLWKVMQWNIFMGMARWVQSSGNHTLCNSHETNSNGCFKG